MDNETKSIIRQINSVCRRATTLQTDIHNVAVRCMEHAEKHGDVSLMYKLFWGLPSGQRRKALLVWVEAFSPISINATDPNHKCGLLKEGVNKNYRPFNIEGAKATPYFEYSNEEVKFVAAGDILGRLWGLKKSAETANEEGRFVGDFELTMAKLTTAIGSLDMSEAELDNLKKEGRELKELARAA